MGTWEARRRLFASMFVTLSELSDYKLCLLHFLRPLLSLPASPLHGFPISTLPAVQRGQPTSILGGCSQSMTGYGARSGSFSPGPRTSNATWLYGLWSDVGGRWSRPVHCLHSRHAYIYDVYRYPPSTLPLGSFRIMGHGTTFMMRAHNYASPSWS
ncbi:uncharacterized protein BCR38DRAFT_139025 [Pseudomassariella vexata]|uniref:Uncharacterized protein n=1 Tax=Pseudomassariella vexata TaxID=1141098 RepID=A0A1Y2EB61_9PEZI|nr:uncharacterized protein BCR38DRAFT_139025 [Pseudomassariella vexata]ORY68798.1 hypothetical protein BCR38DRAFT_139025 [Pseudomassariella vexata]